jgi:hypothetical protein
MITYEDLNGIAKDMCSVDPPAWLEAEDIPVEVMREFVAHKLEATNIMLAMVGPDGDDSTVLSASTAASFQTGWEAHKRFGFPPAWVQNVLGEALGVAKRTTTMGNALAEALNVAVDCLQRGTDADAALDQCHAILLAGQKEAYPE